MKFYQSGRSFFRKMVQIRRHFATKCTIRGTRGAKVQVDATFSGRSMVEMLGVLAIIGVLSVGAISGYSKAMMKYKLNKQAEAINSLINYALQYKDTLTYKEGTITFFNEIFYKLGLIPDGIRYVSNSVMYDIFNNNLYIYYNNGSGTSSSGQPYQNNFWGMAYRFAASSEGAEICRNIANVARENHQNLWILETYKYYNDSDNSTIEGQIFGDAYCTSGRKCLRDLTLNDIDALCNVCDEKTCTLYILWK